MQKIPINELKDGMVLAEEIQDEKGRVLLKMGDPLRTAYLSKLERWGITEIKIQSSGDSYNASSDGGGQAKSPSEVTVTPAITEKYEAILDRKFVDFPSNIMMNTIKEVAVKNLALKEARMRAEG